MMIQYVLTTFILLFFIYLWAKNEYSRLFRLILSGINVIGLIFIWLPELSNSIANSVGVGRGADMLFYLWGMYSFIYIVHLRLCLLKVDRSITKLIRKQAISVAFEKHSNMSLK